MIGCTDFFLYSAFFCSSGFVGLAHRECEDELEVWIFTTDREIEQCFCGKIPQSPPLLWSQVLQNRMS